MVLGGRFVTKTAVFFGGAGGACGFEVVDAPGPVPIALDGPAPFEVEVEEVLVV